MTDEADKVPVCGIAIDKGRQRAACDGGQEYRRAVDEITFGVGCGAETFVDSSRKNRQWNTKAAMKVGELLSLGLKKFAALVAEDEVKVEQPSMDQFARKPAPIAQIVFADDAVDLARIDIKDKKGLLF